MYQVGYQVTKLDLNKMEDQVKFNEIVSKYRYNDTFNCHIPFTMKKHYHIDDEVRYFLSGNAEFIVGDNSIKCGPGTLIEISKNVIHSFRYGGGEELKVQRFFEDEEKYKEYYVQD